MNLTKSLAVLFVLTMTVGCTQFLLAQGTDLGTIRGSVTDSSGALIANARVVILDLSTGTTREAVTNSDGEYQVFGLRPGNYKVTISAPNMRASELTGIVLTGSDVVAANAVLGVATQTEAVEVTTQVPAINTEDQTITDTINSREVIDLPRDSRDVYQFLYLNPNITQGTDAGEFKFLGFQSYGANFSLDGQRSNNAIFGSPTNSEPSLEAVGEVNVLSSDFSAEYAGISNIRITTKRGTSQFHGSAFYNNKNSALAAWQIQDLQGKRDFVPNQFVTKFPTPYFNENDIGGSVGGPIPKIKNTWFFAAYERNYNRSPVDIFNNKLPYPSFWTGDFSPLLKGPNPNPGLLPDVPASVTLTSQEAAADTYQGLGQQFVTIPSRLLNPNVQQLISVYFPKNLQGTTPEMAVDPDSGLPTGKIAGGYQTLLPGGSTRDLGTLRVDHDFSDKDRVYVVYNAQAFVGTGNPAGGVNIPFTGLGLLQTDRRNNTLSGSYVRNFRNNLINEARAGFNREYNFQHSITTLQSFLSSTGLDSSAIDAFGAVVGPSVLATHGFPSISYGGTFQGIPTGGRNTERQQSQYLLTFGDTLTWVIKDHNLKMGADFVRNQGLDGFTQGRGAPRGTMTYANPTACANAAECAGAATDPFAVFLLGLPASNVVYVPESRPNMDAHNWEQGYFFQDDWKVNSRLTLNLGIRYEYLSPFVDKNDLLINFDPTFVDSTTGLKGRIVVPSDKTIPFLDARLTNFVPVVTAGQSGLGIGRGLIRGDKNNVAPRVGVALRLGDKSVVRGGYGIYFPTSAAQGMRDPLETNGFNQSLRKNNDPTQPLQPWPTPMTGGLAAHAGGQPSINAVPFGLNQPLIQQYNATFERDLGLKTSVRFSYLGSTAHGLIVGRDLNQIRPSDVGWGTTLADPDTGIGDGINPCDPTVGNCGASLADYAKIPFSQLGDFLMTFGNLGHSQSNAFQTEVDRRYNHGLMFSASYTYLDQKSTGLDQGNSSLGGATYNQFQPNLDYGEDAWLSRHRFVFYGLYDLPVGRGKKFGNSFSRVADAIIGGWQTSFQMFAKSGTAFTPFYTCNSDCFNSNNAVFPGNTAVGSLDAVGDFSGSCCRPLVVGDFKKRGPNQAADQMFNPDAFAPPPVGADFFDNPQVAKRNILWGPGAWGVNLGLHKDFKFGERVIANLGADINNIFNHPLRMPNADFGGGGGTFAWLGDLTVHVDPNNPVSNGPNSVAYPLLPFDPAETTANANPDFGRAFSTFPQEGVDSRRTIRLRLRITF